MKYWQADSGFMGFSPRISFRLKNYAPRPTDSCQSV